VRFYQFSIWDNCRDYGGYLSREDIEEFLRDLREDELEARLHGNHISLAGRVYKEWYPEPPYWVEPFEIPVTWPRVCVIDPHPRKPMAVVWLAVSPTESVYVYRDLFDPRLTTVRDVADRIKDLEAWGTPENENVVLRIIDSSANANEPTSGDTIKRRFAMEGIITQDAKKRNPQAGHDAIHEALKVRAEWNAPGLVVFNTCRNVKQNFMNFCYEEWATSKLRETKGDRQDYRKNYDDFIDCIRYYYQTVVGYRMLRHELGRILDRDEATNGISMFTKERSVRWPMSSKSSRSRKCSLREMV